jgi:UDP-N-acetylglucosamine 2-epimerase
MIDRFVATRDHAVAHASLGRDRYYSCLRTVDALVGNSSSGLAEAPAVGLPTVDIGERQRGRLRTSTTIHCPPERGAITAAIEKALDPATVVASSSPYGDGQATERIIEAVRQIEDPRSLVLKRFHEFVR